MKDEYVKFETAKLLKEKGFCEENIYCYYQGEYENDNTDVWRGECKFNWNIYDDSYSAPTQQMACRWLREEKEIHILPEISEVKQNPKYYCIIWKTSTLESFIVDLFDSYEDAVEAALKYVLTNLI